MTHDRFRSDKLHKPRSIGTCPPTLCGARKFSPHHPEQKAPHRPDSKHSRQSSRQAAPIVPSGPWLGDPAGPPPHALQAVPLPEDHVSITFHDRVTVGVGVRIRVRDGVGVGDARQPLPKCRRAKPLPLIYKLRSSVLTCHGVGCHMFEIKHQCPHVTSTARSTRRHGCPWNETPWVHKKRAQRSFIPNHPRFLYRLGVAGVLRTAGGTAV